ncbi:exopolyphosphatase [Methylocystis sp. WRRC1]|uniref:exopolyphosphatase n=1 Tax=unclassified Methylocystis TaxID=2625913 RepID=UPI0001F87829|nr:MULTISPECIES: exopolyphosphatase [unclassified Methylocystis]MCC3247337.1 exopolyphosphatase [Methylocystis sp. WRRC1]
MLKGFLRSRAEPVAPVKIEAAPVAIVDIGSNSVRLVVYQALSRAPTPLFNEKAMCGLGKGVVTTGRLPEDGVDKALKALRRYRALCDTMGVGDIEVIATAAARDAENGPAFLDAARAAIRNDITLLSGRREAELSALGVVSAVHEPNGVVGDLGGGSLELIDVKGDQLGKGVTLPLGGLALMDASRRSTRDATRIARKAIADAKPLEHLKGRTFYAVGGTWRSLAKLHMRQRNYPLGVMHNYRIQTSEAADFAELVEHVDSEAIGDINVVSTARRPLLAYGAIVLDEIIRRAKPREIVISAAGVREGMLFERLPEAERRVDPLLSASRELEATFARAPGYGDDLIAWTDDFMRSGAIDETPEEKRLRHAACLLSDIAWRAHPEYRAQRAMNVVTQGPFVSIDHPGRAYLSLAIVLRHEGPDGGEGVATIRSLLTTRLFLRARVLGAAMRVGYLVSASIPGVLPRTTMRLTKGALVLTLPQDFADLASDRVLNRLKALGRLMGVDGVIEIAP